MSTCGRRAGRGGGGLTAKKRWVYHTFKEGKAEGWWKNISAAMSDESGASMKAMQDGYAAK